MGCKKCCVPGCTDKTSPRYRFPHPVSGKAPFQVWVNIIKNSQLEGMSFTDIYNYRRVCKQHFMEEHFSANKRNLNYGAVPTVNVCGIEEASAWSYKTSQDYQPSKMSISAGVHDIQQTSTSAGTRSPPLTECVPLNVQAIGMSDADEIIHTPPGKSLRKN